MYSKKKGDFIKTKIKIEKIFKAYFFLEKKKIISKLKLFTIEFYTSLIILVCFL